MSQESVTRTIRHKAGGMDLPRTMKKKARAHLQTRQGKQHVSRSISTLRFVCRHLRLSRRRGTPKCTAQGAILDTIHASNLLAASCGMLELPSRSSQCALVFANISRGKREDTQQKSTANRRSSIANVVASARGLRISIHQNAYSSAVTKTRT